MLRVLRKKEQAALCGAITRHSAPVKSHLRIGIPVCSPKKSSKWVGKSAR